jgi:NAD(P)-dependent dehydrogenase (short-subunit alcohol dehydrogenase family)
MKEGGVTATTAGNIDPGKPLAGRTALVTGSGQNIGKAIALHFARAGANVVVNGHRNRAAIDSVVAEIEGLGGKAMACLADVADPAAIMNMVKEAQDKFGGVDIAVSMFRSGCIRCSSRLRSKTGTRYSSRI